MGRFRSLPAVVFAAALCALTLSSASVRAADLVKVAILPFGPEGSEERTLSDGVNFELELSEDLLLMPAAEPTAALGGTPWLAEPGDVTAALAGNRIDAAVRLAEIDGNRFLFVHRAKDDAVVFVEPYDASVGARDLAARVTSVLSELDTLPALSARAVAGATATVDDAETPRPRARRRPRATPAPDTLQDGADPKSGDKPKGDLPAWLDAEGKPFDRVGRVALTWSPTYLSYSACQPAGTSVPFLCAPEEGTRPTRTTILPWGAFVGGGASVELYPWLPYLGLAIDVSAFSASVETSAPELFNPDIINVLGGQGSVMALGRGAITLFDWLGLGLGLRAGYQLLFSVADPHEVVLGNGNVYALTLIPSYLTHALATGVTGQVELGEYARVALDVDLIPFALHTETPTTVGDSPFGLGGHTKLQVDVDLLFGFILSASAEASAISVRTVGPGTRHTRGLELFNSGDVTVVTARGGVGVGYHF